MYSTQIYQYVPRQLIVIDTGSSPRRYNNVYSKTLKLHKGSDSRLQFQFLNQEEKPVNITGKEITFRLISYDNTKILLQKSLINTISLNGISELRINSNDLSNITTQKCYYSLELLDDVGLNVPGLMDKNSTGRGTIDIVDGVYPTYISSKKINVLDTSDGSSSDLVKSSIIPTNYNPNITFQISVEEFLGNLTVQGSTNGTSNWYDIEYFTRELTPDSNQPFTGSVGVSVKGYHPYVQLVLQKTSGNVTKILAR